tara:strand:- start:18 stop:887 length:870 start_codon:yes stop_codon:yes gene_type:complete
MAPRPAFLSGLGGGVPTGLKPPSQRDRQPPRRDTTDVSGFDTIGGQDRSKPPQLTPAKGVTPPFQSRVPSIDQIFQKNKIDQEIGGVNNLIAAGDQSLFGSGGSGSNIAQQVLGPSYSKALSLGYQPSQLIDMVTNAQRFGRGIDIDKFAEDLDRFEKFEEGGPGTKIDGQTFLNVQKPTLSANPPEGVMGLLGAMFGPFGEMAGEGLEFLGAGGVGGKVLDAIQQKFSEGKDFLSNLNQPGTLGFRVRALTPEQRRFYDTLTMSQGVSPFEAIEQAERRATGGIATLQ